MHINLQSKAVKLDNVSAMREEKIEIRTKDQYPLAALYIRPKNTRGAVQINAATGTKKEFYLNFARYLAQNGFAVLLYDYRGIGESAPHSLKGFVADLRTWADKDMTAAFDWLLRQHPGEPSFILGHSMGGQLIGLMQNAPQAAGIIMAGSSIGYWPLLPFPSNVFYFFIWYVLQPVATRLAGYLPSSKFGIGEDVPAGVANEFRQWCTSPGYLADYFGKTIRQQYYEQIQAPMLSLVPTDDNIAGRRSVPPLLRLYRRARIEQRWLSPREIGKKKIGHFGLFSRRYKEQIWPLMLDFLEKQMQEKVTEADSGSFKNNG
jgi:predicted alpha/beta hydrolase